MAEITLTKPALEMLSLWELKVLKHRENGNHLPLTLQLQKHFTNNSVCYLWGNRDPRFPAKHFI